MWYATPPNKPDWSVAEIHLRNADPQLALIIERLGPCQLAPEGRFPHDAFLVLCQSIFSQQISGAVAAVLLKRFRALFPRKRPTPPLVLKLTDTQMKSCGLSRQKIAYIRDLALHFVDGRIPLKAFPAMDDAAIIAALTAVHGIGQWTAEMFLMFVLLRPDVFPVADLGIQKGVATTFKKRHPLNKKRMLALTQHWRPHRTVACWYLWRSLD